MPSRFMRRTWAIAATATLCFGCGADAESPGASGTDAGEREGSSSADAAPAHVTCGGWFEAALNLAYRDAITVTP